MLATGGGESYVIFIYDTIDWTTGDSRSGGRNGFPAKNNNFPAIVGFSNAGQGDGSCTIPYSGNSSVLLCLPSGNFGGARNRGVYVFSVQSTSEMICRDSTGERLVINIGEFQHHV